MRQRVTEREGDSEAEGDRGRVTKREGDRETITFTLVCCQSWAVLRMCTHWSLLATSMAMTIG